MRQCLTLSDEKKTAERYTAGGSGVTEVERPWCVEPGSQPDPRAALRRHTVLPPEVSTQSRFFDTPGSPARTERSWKRIILGIADLNMFL